MGVKKLLPLRDQMLVHVRQQWFAGQQQMTTKEEFLPEAVEWFRSTHINDLQGWDAFPDTDVILGCTHFIESLVLKHGWGGLQILPQEYARRIFVFEARHLLQKSIDNGDIGRRLCLLDELQHLRIAKVRFVDSGLAQT